MKTITEVKAYEINDKDNPPLDAPKLLVASHWGYDDRCVLEWQGKEFTVLRRELIAAVQRADCQP